MTIGDRSDLSESLTFHQVAPKVKALRETLVRRGNRGIQSLGVELSGKRKRPA